MNFEMYPRSSATVMTNRGREMKKEIQILDYLNCKKSLLDEIRSIFHNLQWEVLQWESEGTQLKPYKVLGWA